MTMDGDDFFQDISTSIFKAKLKYGELVQRLARAEAQNARFSELEAEYASLKKECESLRLQLESAERESQNRQSRSVQASLSDPISVNGKGYGLTNLKKRLDEAIFDAQNHFQKKCPYCDANLYEGSVRGKMEVDHFFPIEKGGQDFPWNVLPSCKKCNGRKSDKMPFDYLSPERYDTCLEYLMGVKKSATKALELDDIALELVRHVFKDRKDDFRRLRHLVPVDEIYRLFYPNEPSLPVASAALLLPTPTDLVGRFLNAVSRTPISSHSAYKQERAEIWLWLSGMYDSYCRNEKTQHISLRQVKNELKDELRKVSKDIWHHRTVYFSGKSKYCLVINYDLLSPEWKALFDRYFGEAI